MSITIPIAHDFICPWCWVGLLQAKRLKEEFGVSLDWRGYELWPEVLAWPEWGPGAPEPANKPPVPSRFDFILYADGITLPKADKPHRMRTHNAHEALEFAKRAGKADEFVEALYRSYWEEGRDINDPEVLVDLAPSILGDVTGLKEAIETRQFASDIVEFDDDAHEHGIYNVPTFFIGEKRLAEQPYVVIRAAVEAKLSESG
jgi:predicted DsbA family dithiol-disulfide isomerase